MAAPIVPAPFLTGFRLMLGETLNQLFGFPIVATQDGITANPGGGQANAVQLTTPNSRVTTVGTAGDSVRMPPALPGMEWSVLNSAAANSLNVFPAVGEQINGLGVNTAQAVAHGQETWLTCYTKGQWFGPVALA